MTRVQLSLKSTKTIHFGKGAKLRQPATHPYLKIWICHCRGPILSRGPRHNFIVYSASWFFLKIMIIQKIVNQKENSECYIFVQTSPAIPIWKGQVSKYYKKVMTA